ncbi:MAG: 3-oxoacyl-[acyl-carrier protein] reductase, partial [Glaciecola sp.]
VAAAGQRHPMGRIGTPAELAAQAAFLLSPDSAWVSGQILAVDGGMSSMRRF